MSKNHLTIFDPLATLILISGFLSLVHCVGAAQEDLPPPIVEVEIADLTTVITHEGTVSPESFQIRVNVQDIRDVDFQQNLKTNNCTIAANPSGPYSSASRLYPRVSKLDGTDLDFHREELIKSAIGKKVTITRTVPQLGSGKPPEGPAGKPAYHKPTGPVHEVIEGTLLGFKGDSTAYSIQLLGDTGQLHSIESKEIIDLVFQEDLEELKKIAGLLKRQSGYDFQTMTLSAVDPNQVVQISYTQTNVADHAPKLTVFAQLNQSRDSLEKLEARAMIWNDTFYDWSNVTVVFNNENETYCMEGVTLPFGQRGSFLVNPTLPVLSVNQRWNVVAPDDTKSNTATVTSVLRLSNPSDLSMPTGTWNVKDWQGKDLVSGALLVKILPSKNGELIVPKDKTEVVSFKTADLPIQAIEIRGDQLYCSKGTATVFTFSNVEEQSDVIVRTGANDTRSVVISGTPNGSIALPEIVVDPKLQNRKLLDVVASGTSITVLSSFEPQKIEKLDLFREKSIPKLINAGNSVPILDEIVAKKKAIEAIRNALELLQTERKDLAKRPSLGESSSYRISLQRESKQLLQRKDAEILDLRDTLAKAEFGLAEILRLYKKDALPAPITAAQALRDLGGIVMTDKDGNLTDVAFGGNVPARDINEDELFNEMDGAIQTLVNLALPGCRSIDGRRLSELGRSRIAWLDLSGTGVNDATLQNLPALLTLKSLDLSGTSVSSRSIKTILKLKRLEHLSVAGTNFTNAGLKKLSDLESLRSLNLRGTPISKAELNSFRDSRPGVEVYELELNPVFDSKSFWYQRVDGVNELHEKSATFVKEFLRQKAAGKDDLVGINTTSYASPLYFADANSPRMDVAITRCLALSDEDYDELARQFTNVPFPDHAVPADGTDAEMTIFEPSTDTLWEFWRLQKTEEGWQACWGGKLTHVSRSNGIHAKPFGGTATCLPMTGGQITAEELEAGEIKHAMGIALVRAKKGKFSWPAQKDDGKDCDGTKNCIENDLIMEGQRFRLDPNINIDELAMHPVGKIIAKAAQQYGFVVWDKGGTTGLRAKNPKSYTQLGLEDPYPDLFSPRDQWTVLDGFPWENLQFFKEDYGKPEVLNAR